MYLFVFKFELLNCNFIYSIMATLETEIRKLQPSELGLLGQILNHSDSWKKLMAIIPKDDDENSCMFNNEHFLMIEQAIRQQQRSGADIFLTEWSTLGKRRPTCALMLNLLIKAELFRAADYLAVDILKGNPPKRPQFGPAAKIDVSEMFLQELMKQQLSNLDTEPEDPNKHSMAWSIQFAEKEEKTVNFINFSSTTQEVFEDLPKEYSDLIKFSAEAADFKDKEYCLQEARTEDIPLCVRENAFHSTNISESVTSVDFLNMSEGTISSEQTDTTSISDNIIPVAVLEFNEEGKSNSGDDT